MAKRPGRGEREARRRFPLEIQLRCGSGGTYGIKKRAGLVTAPLYPDANRVSICQKPRGHRHPPRINRRCGSATIGARSQRARSKRNVFMRFPRLRPHFGKPPIWTKFRQTHEVLVNVDKPSRPRDYFAVNCGLATGGRGKPFQNRVSAGTAGHVFQFKNRKRGLPENTQ